MSINHFPPMDFPALVEFFEQFDADELHFCLLASVEKALLVFDGRDLTNDDIFGPQALALASQGLVWAGAPWLMDPSGKQDRAHEAVVRGKDEWIFRFHAEQRKSDGMLQITILKLDSNTSGPRLSSLPLAERHAWAWAKSEALELARAAPDQGSTQALGATQRL